MNDVVEIQQRWGKFFVVGTVATEAEAREHLTSIIDALHEGLPLEGAPVRRRGTKSEPRRIVSVMIVDDGYRVRLEGEDFTRAWSELEYWR